MRNLILFVLIFVGFMAHSEEATSSCMIGNSNTEYVSATAYTSKVSTSQATAYVVIANSSNKPLSSLYITVTAEKCMLVNNEAQWTEVTLYSSNKYFSPAIAPNSTTRVDCSNVSSYNGALRNINISIENPSCR